MNRFIGLIPVRNEADNWLDACLTWASNYLDEIVVYDDQSDDNTVEIAERHTPHVAIRPNKIPSFMENESKFRQAGWDYMSEVLDLDETDWVLAFDADEFLVGGFDNRIDSRLRLIRNSAEIMGADNILLPRPEIWNLGQPPQIRTDGFWQIQAVRLVQWKPNGQFRKSKMGCGSVPKQERKPLSASAVQLLHLGYSSPTSRQKHFERFMSLRNHGHNQRHVASIITKPTLVDYHGPMPHLWRGSK